MKILQNMTRIFLHVFFKSFLTLEKNYKVFLYLEIFEGMY